MVGDVAENVEVVAEDVVEVVAEAVAAGTGVIRTSPKSSPNSRGASKMQVQPSPLT